MATAPAPFSLPAPVPAYARMLAAPPGAFAAPLSERILLVVLFATVLASSVAFIEPSPHDILMGALALACLIAGVRFNRTLVVPLVLLVVWNVAGLMSLTRVLDHEKTLQYAGISIYLAVAALIFACLFANNTMPRLTTMRVAYTITAVFGALLGIAGYFKLPGAHLFVYADRAMGAFKDPNVFGPFLIWPSLFIIHRMLVQRISLFSLATLGVLQLGLLLAFSRGAWAHFAVSCAVLLALAFVSAPSQKTRLRIFTLAALSVVALTGLLAVLLSFESIAVMFKERAQLFQSYDVSSGGRFRMQELALAMVLNFPQGMGPLEFARVFGLQQHNVYLQAFLVYGWIGAMAYILLVISTLWVGLRASFARTPWQPYAMTALATFVGLVAEGFIIDTDHWRHFFLLIGIIWGTAAATSAAARQARSVAPIPAWAAPGALR